MGVGEHQRFEEACEDYMAWYDGTIQTLQEFHNSSGTKDDIENRLIKLKVIFLLEKQQEYYRIYDGKKICRRS